MSNPVYVTGHKNPDTDSIVSAIAYAAFKDHFGMECIPCRLGAVPPETEYLLSRFGFDDPHRIYSAKSSIHDIAIDDAATVSPSMTMKEALEQVLKLQNRGLVVTDSDRRLLGIVTLDDLTYMWTKTDEELEEIIKTITSENMAKTLSASVVVRGSSALSGKMHMFPGTKSKVAAGSIAVLRNEDEKMEYCLRKGAAMLVVVTSSPISDEVQSLAKEKEATVMVTELTPLTVTRLIYQTPTISQVMVPRDSIIYFTTDDSLDEAEKKISQSRYRAYPVLSPDDKVVGSISRYHLLTYEKKKYILVDHNEKKQTVDDIDHGEILEILDHHRMGGFESEAVINIVTQPLGATATMIADKYFEADVPLSEEMAGILLGAIVSDTMNFRSPTTTGKDRRIAQQLEEICKVTADELSEGMISATDSLLGKRLIEIVYDDFKEFSINGCKVGLSQASCKSKEEYQALCDDLKAYLADACKSSSYDLMVVMLTNPNGSGSYLIYAGSKEKSMEELYPETAGKGFISGLVSRKKQLLPGVISVL